MWKEVSLTWFLKVSHEESPKSSAQEKVPMYRLRLYHQQEGQFPQPFGEPQTAEPQQ